MRLLLYRTMADFNLSKRDGFLRSADNITITVTTDIGQLTQGMISLVFQEKSLRTQLST